MKIMNSKFKLFKSIKSFKLDDIKKIIIKKDLLFISLFYVFIIILMTWPLLFNMDGFLLPEAYEDINHSDSIQHISKIDEAKDLLDEGKTPIIVDSTDVSQIYILSGLVITNLFNISNVFFHNIYFFFSLFLSGFFMYLFAREITSNKLASFFAGFLYLSSQYLPYAYFWGHANTSQIQWIPLVFLFAERLIKYNKKKDIFFLGIALALQIISVSQTTAYLTFILPLYLFLRILFLQKKELFKTKFWITNIKNFSLSILITVILISWYLIRKTDYEPVIRTIEENTRDYWVATSFLNFVNPFSHLSFNAIPILIFFIGLYFIIKDLKIKKSIKYIPFVIIFFFVLLCMFGPINYFMPYTWLYYLWPYINHFRVPFRMFPFALMCFSLIASYAILSFKQYFKKEYVWITFIIIFSIIIAHILSSYWLSNNHMYFLT